MSAKPLQTNIFIKKKLCPILKKVIYCLKVLDPLLLRSTADNFQFRLNNYKDNHRKALRGQENMQQNLREHFRCHEHNKLF